MSSWKIRRRRGTCSTCERAFDEGEPHFSMLALRGDELEREDLCRACWRQRPAADATPGVAGAESTPARELFWWRTRHTLARRGGLALNLDALEGVFLGLEGRAEAPLRELRFVLCLLLLRKRRLKIERILRDADGEAMLVRRPRHKEELRVPVFDFPAEKLEELRGRLREIFEGAEPGEGAPQASAGDPLPASPAASGASGPEVPGRGGAPQLPTLALPTPGSG